MCLTWSRAIAYGEELVYSGPVYDAMRVEGNKAIVSFRNVGGGLTVKDGDLMPHDGRLKGFTVAGEDKVFHNAEAAIERDRVVVGAPGVPRPIAVRYGWAHYPIVNLYNREGPPASPFRTDDFPVATRPR